MVCFFLLGPLPQFSNLKRWLSMVTYFIKPYSTQIFFNTLRKWLHSYFKPICWLARLSLLLHLYPFSRCSEKFLVKFVYLNVHERRCKCKWHARKTTTTVFCIEFFVLGLQLWGRSYNAHRRREPQSKLFCCQQCICVFFFFLRNFADFPFSIWLCCLHITMTCCFIVDIFRPLNW